MSQAILTAHGFLTQGVEGFIDFMKSVNENRIQRKAIRMTEKELAKLSNAELDDIGISRGDIRHIAQKHYKDIMEENRDKKELVGYANTNLKGWV